jgi:hypothetical protein
LTRDLNHDTIMIDDPQEWFFNVKKNNFNM